MCKRITKYKLELVKDEFNIGEGTPLPSDLTSIKNL